MHFELWAFVVKVHDIDNPGQNVWDKVSFFRIAAVFARSPLPPRCNVGRLVGKPFLTNNIAWGEGGESRIWPKERRFPCEKLIDGRCSAFCKLVPHNFGQDCRSGQEHDGVEKAWTRTLRRTRTGPSSVFFGTTGNPKLWTQLAMAIALRLLLSRLRGRWGPEQAAQLSCHLSPICLPGRIGDADLLARQCRRFGVVLPSSSESLWVMSCRSLSKMSQFLSILEARYRTANDPIWSAYCTLLSFAVTSRPGFLLAAIIDRCVHWAVDAH